MSPRNQAPQNNHCIRIVATILLFFAYTATAIAVSKQCPKTGTWLQVLGAGGPEIEDLHASSAYLIWLDGRARLLVDIGGSAPLRFAESKAQFADLDALLFTHLHVDHSAGLPALVKSSFLSDRQRDLRVLGPGGNQYLPSTREFLQRLFSQKQGVYPYLNEYISPGKGAYTLMPIVVEPGPSEIWRGQSEGDYRLSAIDIHHGPLPALAWRVDVGANAVVFSGDTSARSENLARLAREADLFVAHNAVPEGTTGVARKLHMTPSRIGEVAAAGNVGRLVLSHRMRRTFGQESATLAAVQRAYQGPVEFAEDLSCFRID